VSVLGMQLVWRCFGHQHISTQEVHKGGAGTKNSRGLPAHEEVQAHHQHTQKCRSTDKDGTILGEAQRR